MRVWVLPAAGAALTVAAWWLATIAFGIAPYVLPAPPDVLAVFGEHGGYLLDQTWVTLVETLQGYALAVVAGVLIAVLIATFRIVEESVYPLLIAVNAVPKVAVAPILVVWMGFGQLPKVVMVFLVCFFPIVISTATGLRSTPAEFVELSRSLRASWWRLFLQVRFPHALPQIFVGLKVAISLAVIGAVIGEFVGAQEGLGYVIVQSGASADTALAFAAMVLLGVMSIALFYVLVAIEHLLLPWARETTA
ncbi:ABC transporter permease [Streptosporangium sp. NPDC023825]|uniref:ABC transporter permease n=1 Tax=Streptosporangium sp. NPDC023825 TaxID=3154909 RepID=UPI003418869D